MNAIDILRIQSEVETLTEMYQHFIIEMEEMNERAIAEGYEGLQAFYDHQITYFKHVLSELDRQSTQTTNLVLDLNN